MSIRMHSYNVFRSTRIKVEFTVHVLFSYFTY